MLAPFQLKNDFSMAIPNGMYLKMISRLKIGIKNKYGFIVLRVIFFFMFPPPFSLLYRRRAFFFCRRFFAFRGIIF